MIESREGRNEGDLEDDATGAATSTVRVLLQRSVTSVSVGGLISSVGFGGGGGVGVLRGKAREGERGEREGEG